VISYPHQCGVLDNRYKDVTPELSEKLLASPAIPGFCQPLALKMGIQPPGMHVAKHYGVLTFIRKAG